MHGGVQMNKTNVMMVGLCWAVGCMAPVAQNDGAASTADEAADSSQNENGQAADVAGGVTEVSDPADSSTAEEDAANEPSVDETEPAEADTEPGDDVDEPADTAPGDSDPRVRLTVFTESLCPCAAQWIYDFRESVLPAVGEIIRIERYVDGSAHGDGSVTSFHGSREVSLQQNEVCVQHLAAEQGDADGGFIASLLWTACINGACSGPGGSFGLEFCEHQGNVDEEGENEVGRACAEQLGLSFEEIYTCATGELGQQLHWESSSYGNTSEVTYGMQGLPVVWINGERHSEFWDCNSHSDALTGLIDLVCDLYAGPAAPEVCLD